MGQKVLVKAIYDDQIASSKIRKQEKPSYTKKEFIDKYINNEVYLSLYINWVGSGYLKDLAPSFDRIDDYKGYSFDNLQLMRWFENRRKAHLDRKEGRNNKHSKAITGTNIKTGDKLEFHSMNEADRNGFCNVCICNCCRGKVKTHKGYIWSYK